MSRAYYIDRIRVILTGLVILHHTAITYGAPGGWYYREVPTNFSLTGIVFVLLVSVNQAYFMGFFFLLAGYFTPASYSRKGLGQFCLDRLMRLGVPWIGFAVLLDPLTSSFAQAAGQPPPSAADFLRGYGNRILSGDWHDGPLWFAQALLIFSAGYVIWSQFPRPEQQETPLPRARAWLFSALAVGAAAILIRQWFPVGTNFIGLQLGYFASYIFLFVLGTVAYRRNWLQQLNWKTARGWTIAALALMPVMLIAAALAGRLSAKPVNFAGGWGFPAVLYAFWEPFVAWGVIAGYLIWFRDHANRPSRLWQYFSTRAYAIYILHAPVLVAIAVVLRPWVAPAILKFAVTGSLAMLATVGVSSMVLQIPGARRLL